MSAETSLEIWLFPMWREAIRTDSPAAWEKLSDAIYYAMQGCAAGGGINSDADELLRFLSNVAFEHRMRANLKAGMRKGMRAAA